MPSSSWYSGRSSSSRWIGARARRRLAERQERDRSDDDRAGRDALPLRLFQLTQHLRRVQDEPCVRADLRDDVVVVGVEPLRHLQRRGPPAAEAGQHLAARHVGQAQVENHNVGAILGGGAQASGAGRRGDHLVTTHAQVDAQRPQQLHVVVDHQHQRRDHESPIRVP
jgi:hypothetical protein